MCINVRPDGIFTVKDIKLNKPDPKSYIGHTLDITYEVVSKEGNITEYTVKGVRLPVKNIPSMEFTLGYLCQREQIDVGYGLVNFNEIIKKDIKKKMTKAEIEKLVGCEVEIVD